MAVRYINSGVCPIPGYDVRWEKLSQMHEFFMEPNWRIYRICTVTEHMNLNTNINDQKLGIWTNTSSGEGLWHSA